MLSDDLVVMMGSFVVVGSGATSRLTGGDVGLIENPSRIGTASPSANV